MFQSFLTFCCYTYSSRLAIVSFAITNILNVSVSTFANIGLAYRTFKDFVFGSHYFCTWPAPEIQSSLKKDVNQKKSCKSSHEKSWDTGWQS